MKLAVSLLGCCSLLLLGCDRSADQTDRLVILGSLSGVGQEIVEEAFIPFTAETGIDVVYEGTDAFATVLPIRVAGGNVPDLAIFPQPGLMADLAQEGSLTPLDEFIEPATLEAAFGSAWVELGSVDTGDDRHIYGLWMRADPKSLVWYSPTAFAAAGYKIPESWDELMELTDTIAATGTPPWCIGMESGEATGWVGTDWVEDILLRNAGTDTYDRWVNHDIPFNAPPVQAALETFGAIARDSRYARGGTVGVLSTPFGDAPAPLFSEPPGCYLHRQASFITDFLPESVEPGRDAKVFLLPGSGGEAPLLTGGLVIAMTNNTPAARAAMEYLTTVVPHESWAARGYISPHRQIEPDIYPNEGIQQMASVLEQADTIRFDGSDLMPASVGTGTFWQGMVEYLSSGDAATVLEAIEDSWPEGK